MSLGLADTNSMHKRGNQGLEYSKENYTQYFVITYKKKMKKNVHIYEVNHSLYTWNIIN